MATLDTQKITGALLHILAEVQAAIADVKAAEAALPADASDADKAIAEADAIYPHASKLAKALFGKGGDLTAG